MGHEKVAIIGRWPLYEGQNEWVKAVLGLAKVVFIERWPSYKGGHYGQVSLYVYTYMSHAGPICHMPSQCKL